MRACACRKLHTRRRVVLTGGPGAGKTAVLELEATADASDAAIVLCDRGTVDGAAYWPGPGDFWPAVGTTLEEQLRRYDAVIHLRAPGPAGGYSRDNPLRIESAAEAAAVDERILRAWERHPRRFVVEATADFLAKAARALTALQGELPACCRRHVVPGLQEHLREEASR